TLFKYPNLESMLMQGVTSIIGGNCGSSLAPLASSHAIHGIRKWADLSDININWTTFKEYLWEIDALNPGVNVGSFTGYGTLRRGIVGNERRLLTIEEREQLKQLLRDALHDGSFGLSLGLSYGHEAISPTEELIEVSRVLQEEGGILKVHLRSEGNGLLAAVNEVVRIGREAGVSVQISHLKAIGRKSWRTLTPALDLIRNTKASGLDINFDVSPYATTGSSLYLLIPAWARQGGFEELFKRIDNPEERKKIIDTLSSYTLHPDKILVTSAPIKNIVGKTLADIAETAGMSAEEALLATVRASEGRVSIIGKTVSVRNTKHEVADLDSFIASDGEGYSQEAAGSGNLVHPRSFGAFAHFWHRFVRELALMPEQEAIKKITSAPAQKVGLTRRGAIKKGNFADITVFDPATFKEHSTYRDPYHYSTGIAYVWVNGKMAVENAQLTHIRSGRALKR
ncbi:MAG: amidohydrolase family protein, partial [Candidatus Sungbacteria bacterium]|nr:amidohydrolase family protein [Candidatus Sungbacteria bacterium]